MVRRVLEDFLFSDSHKLGSSSVISKITKTKICWCFQEDPEYEEPPDLPARSDDFLEIDAPPLPHRSADVEEEEDEDGGEYEELAEPPPPALTGLCLPSVKRQTVHIWNTLKYQRFLCQLRTIMKTWRLARRQWQFMTTKEVWHFFIFWRLLLVSRHVRGQVLTSSLPHRRRWRDLLQPGWHHHQRRDDWRGLVEGSVSRMRWSFPGSLRSAAGLRDTLREFLNSLHFCTNSRFFGLLKQKKTQNKTRRALREHQESALLLYANPQVQPLV